MLLVVGLFAVCALAACGSVGDACAANGTACQFGAVCAGGRCQDGPDGVPCASDAGCEGLYLSGKTYLCLNETCTVALLPGDACGPAAPGYCVGKCAGGVCGALAAGQGCTRDVECGIVGRCNGTVCVDVAYLGERCVDGQCQASSFCEQGHCVPLFLKGPGENCTQDNECATSDLCVDGKCVRVPLEQYGAPCPCQAPLSCHDGRCFFPDGSVAPAQRLVGCREALRESILCSSRAKCFGQGWDATSCSMRSGCYHEIALLRNCLFCNASVPVVARRVDGCVADVCVNPGLSHLVKVSIAVGCISFALLVASALIHAWQRRRSRQGYKYTKM